MAKTLVFCVSVCIELNLPSFTALTYHEEILELFEDRSSFFAGRPGEFASSRNTCSWLFQRWLLLPGDAEDEQLARERLDVLDQARTEVCPSVQLEKEMNEKEMNEKETSEMMTSVSAQALRLHVLHAEKTLSYKEMSRVDAKTTQDLQDSARVSVEMGQRRSLFFATPQEHWKMSEEEDFLRRRSVLEVNTHFTSHADATYMDTVGTPQWRAQNISVLEEEEDQEEETSSIIHPPKLLSKGVAVDEKFQLVQGETWIHASERVKWVTQLNVQQGRLELSSISLFFFPPSNTCLIDDDAVLRASEGQAKWEKKETNKKEESLNTPEAIVPMRWALGELTEIHARRYLLRSTALELFFGFTSIFISFASQKDRERFLNALLLQRPPRLEKFFDLSPSTVLQRSWATLLWQRGEMSNFEYLMRLNSYAGRSYNDITQYPVFPWVLKDYTSSSLDLDDPGIYRDLSLPMGALNPKRLDEFIERYQVLASQEDELSPLEGSIPAFHYGSHYSSAGVVLHYLLRMEPFTSLAIDLQGGKFDCPDRLFFSIQDCWQGCLTSNSDVKELTPEFYYSADFLVNKNQLDLGKRQDNAGEIDHVELPPWAHDNPDTFVQVMRQALESDYVSQHLHLWIDLIFGYKQTGQAAVDAHNVFYYLTYEDAIDLDAIKDPVRRQGMKTQIMHFGQTPSQLLTKPHPKRFALKPTLCCSNSNLALLKKTVLASDAPVTSIHFQGDKILTLHRDLSTGTHTWDKTGVLKPSKIFPLAIHNDAACELRFVCAYKLLISVGYLEPKVRVDQVQTRRRAEEHKWKAHSMRVLSVSLSENEHWLATGAEDCTVAVWSIQGHKDVRDEMLELFGAPTQTQAESSLSFLFRLFGHTSAVTSVCVSSSLGVVLSGSRDGSLLVHSLQGHHLIRGLCGMAKSVMYTCVCPSACVLVAASQAVVMTKGVNGQDLASVQVDAFLKGELLDVRSVQSPSDNAELVVVVSRTGHLVLLTPLHLRVVHEVDIRQTVTAMACDHRGIVLGLDSGDCVVVVPK